MTKNDFHYAWIMIMIFNNPGIPWTLANNVMIMMIIMIILKIFDDPSMNNYNDNDEDDYNDNIAGIPWTLHSWIRTLLTAQLGGLTNILDELLQVRDVLYIHLY